MSQQADGTIDVQNQNCPMPVVKAANAMKELEMGQTLLILANDTASECNIPSWANAMGHELVETVVEGAATKYFVRKKN